MRTHNVSITPSEPLDQLEAALDVEFDAPFDVPRNRKEIYERFGNPGAVIGRYMHESIGEYRDMPGVPERLYFQCHQLVEPFFREAFRRAAVTSDYQIERAGCFVFRHIRRDPRRPLSLHSWGIAVDINPKDNRAHTFKRGECPAPWSDEWLERWPDGVDEMFVRAFESVGFTWGGTWSKSGGDFAERAKGVAYCDPMHLELRARR